MPLTTTTIAGQVAVPDGAAINGAFIRFVLSKTDTDDAADIALVPRVVSLPLASDGTVSASLWPNTRGLLGTYYVVAVVFFGEVYGRDKTYPMGGIVVPESGLTVQLQDLLDAFAVAANEDWGLVTTPATQTANFGLI